MSSQLPGEATVLRTILTPCQPLYTPPHLIFTTTPCDWDRLPHFTDEKSAPQGGGQGCAQSRHSQVAASALKPVSDCVVRALNHDDHHPGPTQGLLRPRFKCKGPSGAPFSTWKILEPVTTFGGIKIVRGLISAFEELFSR